MADAHYARVCFLNPQLGMNSRFYATCTCGWNSPMYRTPERAWDDGKAHQKAEHAEATDG